MLVIAHVLPIDKRKAIRYNLSMENKEPTTKETMLLINFRVSVAQKEILRRAAERQGLPLGTWIRFTLLQLAKEQARD